MYVAARSTSHQPCGHRVSLRPGRCYLAEKAFTSESFPSFEDVYNRFGPRTRFKLSELITFSLSLSTEIELTALAHLGY